MKFGTGILILFVLAVSGCATAPTVQLNSGAGHIKVAKSDPGDNYELIGPVSGVDGKGCGGFGYRGTYERATTNLINNTHEMGGDYAQIISLTEPYLMADCFVNKYVIRANAYKKVRNQPSPLPIVNAGGENLPQQLRELKALLDDGIISRQEFEKQKSKLLEKGF